MLRLRSRAAGTEESLPSTALMCLYGDRVTSLAHGGRSDPSARCLVLPH
ncbi:hypothetical protein ABTY96_08455 [Streptomyces sp. NPDC096057]